MDLSSITAIVKQFISFILALLKATGAIDDEVVTDVSGKADEVVGEADTLLDAVQGLFD